MEQPESPAVGNKHLVAECSAGSTVGATGTPARARFEGPCLSYHFAVIFFLKEGARASVGSLEPVCFGHQCLIFWTLCTLPSWGKKLRRAVLLGPVWKMASSSPQGGPH